MTRRDWIVTVGVAVVSGVVVGLLAGIVFDLKASPAILVGAAWVLLVCWFTPRRLVHGNGSDD